MQRSLRMTALWIFLSSVALVACAGMSAPSSPTATTSDSSLMVEYRQNGGFAGLDDRLEIRNNGQATLTTRGKTAHFTLRPATLDTLRASLDAADFAKLGGKHVPAKPGADLIEYVVTYRGNTVTTADTAIPAGLQPSLDMLNQIIEGQR